MFSEIELRDRESVVRVLTSKEESLENLRKDIEKVTVDIHESRITRKVKSEIYERAKKEFQSTYSYTSSDEKQLERMVEECALNELKLQIDGLTQNITTLRLKRKAKTLVKRAMEENVETIKRELQEKWSQISKEARVKNKTIHSYAKFHSKTRQSNAIKLEKLEVEVEYLKEEKGLLVEQIGVIQEKYKNAKTMLDIKELKLEEINIAMTEMVGLKAYLKDLQNQVDIANEQKTQLSQKLTNAECLISKLERNKTKLNIANDEKISLSETKDTIEDLQLRLKEIQIKLDKTAKEKKGYYRILYRTKIEKNDLAEQLKTTQNENNDLLTKVDILTTQNTGLLDKLEMSDREKYVFEEKYKTERHHSDKLKIKIRQQKQTERKENRADDIGDEMMDLKKSIQYQQERLLEVSKENEELANQVDTLKDENRDIQTETKNLQKNLQEYENIAKNKTNEIETVNLCLKDLQNKFEDAKSEKIHFEKQNKQLANEIEIMNSNTNKENGIIQENAELQAIVNELRLKLEEKKKENQYLESTFDETERLKGDLSDMQMKLQMFNNDKWELQLENEKLTEDIETVSRTQKISIQENEELKELVEELRSDLDKMKSENNDKAQKLINHDGKVVGSSNNLQREAGLDEIQDENDVLKGLVEELRNNIQMKTRESEDLVAKLNTVSDENSKLEYKLKESDQIDQQNDTFTSLIRDLRGNLENTNKANRNLEKQLVVIKDENNMLKNKIKEDADLNAKTNSCSTQMYEDLKDVVQELRGTLETTSKQKDELLKELNRVKEDKHRLEAKALKGEKTTQNGEKVRVKEQHYNLEITETENDNKIVEQPKPTSVENQKQNNDVQPKPEQDSEGEKTKDNVSDDEDEDESETNKVSVFKFKAKKKEDIDPLDEFSDWDDSDDEKSTSSNEDTKSEEEAEETVTHKSIIMSRSSELENFGNHDGDIVTSTPRKAISEKDILTPTSSSETCNTDSLGENFSSKINNNEDILTSTPRDKAVDSDAETSDLDEKYNVKPVQANRSVEQSYNAKSSETVESELKLKDLQNVNDAQDEDDSVNFDDVSVNFDDDTVDFDDDDDDRAGGNVDDLLMGLDKIETKNKCTKLIAEQIKKDFKN